MKPKISPFDFGEVPANFEDSSSVTCLVLSGDLPVDIQWLFNDYPINSYSGITIGKMGKKGSVLMIESVNGRHAGNYTCQVSNSAGSETHSATLVVNGLIFVLILFVIFSLFSLSFMIKEKFTSIYIEDCVLSIEKSVS